MPDADLTGDYQLKSLLPHNPQPNTNHSVNEWAKIFEQIVLETNPNCQKCMENCPASLAISEIQIQNTKPMQGARLALVGMILIKKSNNKCW